MAQIKTVRTQGTPPHVPVIEPLSITENGVYTAPTGVDGYSPITVNTPIGADIGIIDITAYVGSGIIE